MREAKRKLLLTILALALVLLVTPFVGTVIAGKGQDRLSIRFELGPGGSGAYDEAKMWNCPKKVPLTEYTRVFQMRGGTWGDPAEHAGFLIVVDETDLDIEFDDDDIRYSCSYDATLRNAFYGQEVLPYVIMNIRVRDTWEIENVGFIEILTVDKAYDYANLYEGTHGEGSFVGHGVINGQNIKLSGATILEIGESVPHREGMVMGWPT